MCAHTPGQQRLTYDRGGLSGRVSDSGRTSKVLVRRELFRSVVRPLAWIRAGASGAAKVHGRSSATVDSPHRAGSETARSIHPRLQSKVYTPVAGEDTAACG